MKAQAAPHVWVDALEFEAQAQRYLADPSTDTNAVDLNLYRGNLLTDFYDDWVLLAREKYRSLYLETLLAYTQQLREHSDYAQAIVMAGRVLDLDRANERAYQHQMFCYAALGNRSAALKRFEACRDALMDELDVEPSGGTRQLYKWIRQAPAEQMPLEAAVTNLPIPLTRFFGRRQELVELNRDLAAFRLITLTGPGGSGKTRLAIRAATAALDSYPDGVWWVSLGELEDDRLLWQTVAKVLGAPEIPGRKLQETLVNFLKARRLLLVLDNCEHMVEASATLAEHLLSRCADLQILATSREKLGIPGEQVRYVGPLPVPEVRKNIRAEQLADLDSVQLFIDRAAAVQPKFQLTDENALAIAQICVRLEGLPLALELVATRANILRPMEIAARLDSAFEFLTEGKRNALRRHKTLKAVMDWSYDLLSVPERNLFGRLSVFAGGWTLPAAEAVCAGGSIKQEEILSLLARLVEKSLVEVQEQAGAPRYRMLQPLRQYSRTKLEATRGAGVFRDRHLAYYMEFVDAPRPHLGYFLSDDDLKVWIPRFEADFNNLRAAVRWAIEKEGPDPPVIDSGLRIVSQMHWFLASRGHFAEGRAWLEQLLKKRAAAPLWLQARAFLTAGFLACWQGDFSSGSAPLERSFNMYQQLEDGQGIAFAMHGLGFAHLGTGKILESRRLFEESHEHARQEEDRWLESFSSHFLAITLTYLEEYDAASSCFEEGIEIIQQLNGNKQGIAFSLFHLARIARLRGNPPAAESRLLESMELFNEIGDPRGIAYCLTGFAILRAIQEELRSAARISGAVASLQGVLGSFLEAPLQVEYDHVMADVRAVLDEEIFAKAFSEGQALAMQTMIEEILENEPG